jgi:hypothetical protein
VHLVLPEHLEHLELLELPAFLLSP